MFKGFYILIFFAGILAVESCKNNDEVFKTVLPAFFNVVNASPDTLNFYLNGTRQNNNSSLFPGGQSYYLNTPSGMENIQFKKAGAFTVLFNVPLMLNDSLNYSLYVTGTSSTGTFSTVDALDTIGIDNQTNFKLRFVNASPDAGNLNVSVDSATYNGAFKSTSAFLLYGSGTKEVKVYQSGSATPRVDTMIVFQPGHAYTLFSKGLLNGKGSAFFDVGVALNL